jgi:hypothetical protein
MSSSRSMRQSQGALRLRRRRRKNNSLAPHCVRFYLGIAKSAPIGIVQNTEPLGESPFRHILQAYILTESKRAYKVGWNKANRIVTREQSQIRRTLDCGDCTCQDCAWSCAGQVKTNQVNSNEYSRFFAISWYTVEMSYEKHVAKGMRTRPHRARLCASRATSIQRRALMLTCYCRWRNFPPSLQTMPLSRL